jgi:CDP-glucose 4,6-dehydratase
MENLDSMINIYKNKKVLITGNTGFKGSWLSCILSFLQAKQIGFALEPNSNPSHFDLLNFEHKNYFFDILDAGILNKVILDYKPDIIFHLAAQSLVRESYLNPFKTYETNVMGTLNLFESVRSAKIDTCIVVVTTDKVYENKEWVFPYRENDALGGFDIYSSSKASTEILTKSYERSFFNKNEYGISHNVLIASARAGNVIGGGDWSTDRLIPDLVKSASTNKKSIIRNPESIRPWQHVLDCLYGYLLLGSKLLNKEVIFADAFNFAPSSNDTKSVYEVVKEAQINWKSIEFVIEKSLSNFHEAEILKLDNSKARSLLKWSPRLNCSEAVDLTIEWYKSFYLENRLITLNQIEKYFANI